ncbi:hypothetical protein Hanom_Chr01g00079451 [Helianthus anomalus]
MNGLVTGGATGGRRRRRRRGCRSATELSTRVRFPRVDPGLTQGLREVDIYRRKSVRR